MAMIIMERLQFSIDIKAPKESVWKVLWEEETFRDWTSVFAESDESSYIKSSWNEGGRFEFVEAGVGSYGTIDKIDQNELMSFRHLGEIRDRKDDPFDDGDRLETYTLREENGITTLTPVKDVPDEYKSLFEEATPRAFERIKELLKSSDHDPSPRHADNQRWASELGRMCPACH